MIVLIAGIAALVVAALILGIVGFGLVGQLRRLRRAVAAAQSATLPQLVSLRSQLPEHSSRGRHSAERHVNVDP